MALKKQNLYPASVLIKELNISDKYLKRILTTLTNHSIINSVQGRYGGFGLNKSVAEISLYEIVKAVENIEKYFGCVLGFESCSDENPCLLHKKWIPVREELMAFLKMTHVSDVINNPQIIKH